MDTVGQRVPPYNFSSSFFEEVFVVAVVRWIVIVGMEAENTCVGSVDEDGEDGEGGGDYAEGHFGDGPGGEVVVCDCEREVSWEVIRFGAMDATG